MFYKLSQHPREQHTVPQNRTRTATNWTQWNMQTSRLPPWSFWNPSGRNTKGPSVFLWCQFGPREWSEPLGSAETPILNISQLGAKCSPSAWLWVSSLLPLSGFWSLPAVDVQVTEHRQWKNGPEPGLSPDRSCYLQGCTGLVFKPFRYFIAWLHSGRLVRSWQDQSIYGSQQRWPVVLK